MDTTVDLLLVAAEYQRIGQEPGAGERWRHPYGWTAAAYLRLLRRVPDGSGLRGYLALLATDKAERLVRE